MVNTIGHRLVILTLVLACCNFIVQGQGKPTGAGEGVLAGVVADKAENAPIPDAFVYIYGPYKKTRMDASISIDDAGQFRISLAPGLYNVFVAAAGFAPTCKLVKIRSGEVTRLDPRLEPDFEYSER